MTEQHRNLAVATLELADFMAGSVWAGAPPVAGATANLIAAAALIVLHCDRPDAPAASPMITRWLADYDAARTRNERFLP